MSHSTSEVVVYGIPTPPPDVDLHRPIVWNGLGHYQWLYRTEDTTYVSGSWSETWGEWLDLNNEEQGLFHFRQLASVLCADDVTHKYDEAMA